MLIATLLVLSVLGLLSSGVDIDVADICGNKLVGSCPGKISLKVVGGQSSCAEKVPWNVLVENRKQRTTSGEYSSTNS